MVRSMAASSSPTSTLTPLEKLPPLLVLPPVTPPVTLCKKPPTAAVAPPPIWTFSTSWAAMPAIWETTELLTVVVPISVLRGLPWLLSSLMFSSFPTCSFPTQMFSVRCAHNAATVDARSFRLPPLPLQILNPASGRDRRVGASASALVGAPECAPVGVGAGADQPPELVAEAPRGTEPDPVGDPLYGVSHGLEHALRPANAELLALRQESVGIWHSCHFRPSRRSPRMGALV